jgi:hypothetical protein
MLAETVPELRHFGTRRNDEDPGGAGVFIEIEPSKGVPRRWDFWLYPCIPEGISECSEVGLRPF